MGKPESSEPIPPHPGLPLVADPGAFWGRGSPGGDRALDCEGLDLVSELDFTAITIGVTMT
ncbi:MAG: hypothetical protein L3K07_06110 [Thermoplasmata archaeon]|nr:hypothetical protein [Thermoplasmata archaeon]